MNQNSQKFVDEKKQSTAQDEETQDPTAGMTDAQVVRAIRKNFK